MPFTTTSFGNFAGLTIVDGVTESQTFNESITVWARITDLNVNLVGLSHTFPDDLDFLLVGPDGSNLEFWSDSGGGTPHAGGNYTIDDSAATLLPDNAFIASGTYRPSDYETPETSSNWAGLPSMVINHPAPTGTATLNSAFGGDWLNGTWSFFVRDDAGADAGSLTGWSVSVTVNVIGKPDDFNFSNTSDILWQNSDGTPAIWLMNGTNIIAAGGFGGFNPGPTWHVEGSGDFNNDGRADVLWQNDNGTPAIWLMNGLNPIGQDVVNPNPGPTWHVEGTGDFNFDGMADILWQNDNGTPAIWLMNGTNIIAAGGFGGFNPGPTWHIEGTGDFNNDGRSDILWQNDNGTPAIWLMNGLNPIGQAVVNPNPGPTWHVEDTGDFNNDGRADILWQNDNGTPAIWLMNGTNIIAAGGFGGFNPGPTWHVEGAGDYNGDGKSDVLWQNDNGTPAIWLMNGLNPIGQAVVNPNPGPDWHII